MPQSTYDRFKQTASQLCPGLYRWYQTRYGNAGITERIQKFFADRHIATVIDGPFAGLNYVSSARCSAYWPKLIGCYELELYPWINEIIDRAYPTVIDIGCAEGYYAVGLAKRMPLSHLYAFDIDPEARELCGQLAEANGVSSRVSIEGYCTPELLNSLISNKSLVICDCEGAELELLDLELAPHLAHTDILVELHEFVLSGLTATIRERFRASHDIQIVDSQPRDPNLYPILQGLGPKEMAAAVDEVRPGIMQWAYMTAKKTDNREPNG